MHSFNLCGKRIPCMHSINVEILCQFIFLPQICIRAFQSVTSFLFDENFPGGSTNNNYQHKTWYKSGYTWEDKIHVSTLNAICIRSLIGVGSYLYNHVNPFNFNYDYIPDSDFVCSVLNIHSTIIALYVHMWGSPLVWFNCRNYWVKDSKACPFLPG